MNKDIQRLWDEAEKGGEADIGDIVVCDFCSKDYTQSDRIGGFLFQSKGVCPDCSPKMLTDIQRYHEQHFIKAIARKDESFKDFIIRIRG